MPNRYSPVQQGFHWLTVGLMFSILPVAWVVMSLKEDTPPFTHYLNIHEGLGLLILGLTLARLAWRLVDRPPRHPRDTPGWSVALSVAVGLGLLAMMVAMPLSGYIWSNGHGFDVTPFKLVRMPRLLWGDRAAGDLGKSVHVYGQWLVYGLIGLHLAGVAYHLVLRRDGLLGRMLPSQALH